jgi:hypothetical protein
MNNLDSFDGYAEFSKRGTLPEYSGIYFVAEGNQIVYIGQSVNIKRRFILHHRAMDFADLNDPRVYWKSCEVKDLQIIEKGYIAKFNPLLNKVKSDNSRTYRPRPKKFGAREGDHLIFGEIRKPELVKVLSVSENEIELQTGNDIIVLRFPKEGEVVLAQ